MKLNNRALFILPPSCQYPPPRPTSHAPELHRAKLLLPFLVSPSWPSLLWPTPLFLGSRATPVQAGSEGNNQLVDPTPAALSQSDGSWHIKPQPPHSWVGRPRCTFYPRGLQTMAGAPNPSCCLLL